MSGGSPGGSTTTSYPPWAIPYAADYLTGISGLIKKDLAAGYPSSFNSSIAPFTPYQKQGFTSGASAAGAAGSLIDPTFANVAATQNGQYLNPATNPWLKATFNAAAQPVTQQFRDTTAPGINGMFAQAGSFGGSANQQAMSDAQKNLGLTLDNLATGIYGGNYQQERQNQLQQQGMLGSLLNAGFMPSQELLGLGGQQQQQQQNILDTGVANAKQAFGFPFDLYSQLGSAIQQAIGGQGVTTVKSGGKGLF